MSGGRFKPDGLTLEGRLLANIMPEPNSGCWLWMLAVSKEGYGATTYPDGRCAKAHRAAYEVWRGAKAPRLLS